MIIPTYGLERGEPYKVDQTVWAISGPLGVRGHSVESAILRFAHLVNMERLPEKWYGVIGPDPSNNKCVLFSSVSKVLSSGAIYHRESMSVCGYSFLNFQQPQTSGHQFTEKPCPIVEATGGDFHFYGEAPGWTGHSHSCIDYYPNPDLSPSGYAIGEQASVAWGTSGWPNYLPEPYKSCNIRPQLVAKLADALLKDAAKQPGYDGVPVATVKDEDARPGDTKVGDLGDNPTNNSPTPNGGENDDPPTTNNPTPTTSTGDECDFKSTTNGCTDPGTPNPTLEEPSTGIMDPIFDWLPDLPSLTIDTGGECPTWNIDLSSFGGSAAWNLTVDKQCELTSIYASQLGALMIAVFGIAAAMIILRA